MFNDKTAVYMLMCNLKHDLNRVNIRILLITGEKGRDYNLVFTLSCDKKTNWESLAFGFTGNFCR